METELSLGKPPRTTAGKNLTDARTARNNRSGAKRAKSPFEQKVAFTKEIASDLGRAGQIAMKLSSLRYQRGSIGFKTGKLEGKGGLVCTSFAKIFGALWFFDDPLEQKSLNPHGLPKKQYKAKTSVPYSAYGSPAPIYGGSMFTSARGFSNLLISLEFDQDRLFSVIRYSPRGKRQHIFFLIFAESLCQWVKIESVGTLGETAKGPGPGIYRIDNEKIEGRRKFYKAWNWGPRYKETSTAIDEWKY